MASPSPWGGGGVLSAPDLRLAVQEATADLAILESDYLIDGSPAVRARRGEVSATVPPGGCGLLRR